MEIARTQGAGIEAAGASHPGLVRAGNEDWLVARIPPSDDASSSRGALFAIADGVGGHAGGEIASRTAAETFLAEWYSPRAPRQTEAALRLAVEAANARVLSLTKESAAPEPSLGAGWNAMHTTLTGLVLVAQRAYLAHIGDCRVYLLRRGELTQITADHSEVAELLRLRLITPEQAQTHPRRSVLTRTLGMGTVVRPDFQRLPVEAGDRFLMCSDGLWGEIEPETIARQLAQPPHDACRTLLRLALEHGGSDNVSLHVIHVVDPGATGEIAASPAGRIARLLAGLRR